MEFIAWRFQDRKYPFSYSHKYLYLLSGEERSKSVKKIKVRGVRLHFEVEKL